MYKQTDGARLENRLTRLAAISSRVFALAEGDDLMRDVRDEATRFRPVAGTFPVAESASIINAIIYLLSRFPRVSRHAAREREKGRFRGEKKNVDATVRVCALQRDGARCKRMHYARRLYVARCIM